MPTPVNAARQCLTDDAARALDDAVAVARRRSHSQTTSLHAVSALLVLPSSSLREACGRVRSSGHSPALQLRALELCVGVALDRLPSAKNLDDDPPISNSLMAAIKRSQANQRRNPESFHLQQMCHNQSQNNLAAAPAVMKVELKHYILSILDDPIVSRVLGDAGYRSCDVKLGVVSPPVSAGLRFSRALMRCPPPPIFMMDSDWRRFKGDEDGTSRRIVDVLAKRTGRNPLLFGASAAEALNSFKACVRNRKPGVLPSEIDGVEVFCIADMIAECIMGCGSEEKMRLGLKEVEVAVVGCAGRGVVVSVGDVKVLVADNGSIEIVNGLVSELGNLLRRYRDKLWLVGAVPDDEIHKKFAGRFPGVEANWDLHLLPVTYNLFGEGFGPKSSLMRSFVPFGGFFSNPSDYSSLSSATRLISRCQSCNEKYEHEVATILKVGDKVSSTDQCSSSLPSCLQNNLHQYRETDTGKAKLEGTTFRARILGLQQKWNDICQNLHPRHQSPKSDVSCSKVQSAGTGTLHVAEGRKQSSSSSRDSSINQSSSPNSSASMATSSKKGFPRGIAEVSEARMSHSPAELPAIRGVTEVSKESITSLPELPAIRGIVEVTKASVTNSPTERLAIIPASQQISVATPKLVPLPRHNLSFTPGHIPCSHMISVTTDLGLGTIYSSKAKPAMQDCGECPESLSTSVSKQFVKLPLHGTPLDLRDFKSLWRSLNNSVSWQDEAIHQISHCISRCKNASERHRSSNIWLVFVGHDKVGKRKIAAALAEAMSGRKLDLISVDLCSQDGLERSQSMFFCTGMQEHNVLKRGKTMVDCIASQLSNRPNSVVFFENLDKAEMLIQTSLLRAIRTGKFPDSHGREISLNNMIFILAASSTEMASDDACHVTKQVRFWEERILEAKCWKLRFAVGYLAAEASQSSYKNILITQPGASLLGKRKFSDLVNNYSEGGRNAARSFLDLNLPVEELEQDLECGSSESESFSEGSEAGLEQFFSEVDEKVALKPYNFDALAERVLKAISTAFENTCPGMRLEISHQAMNQILAASWLSDRTTAAEEWVKSVLSKSFVEAEQRYHHLSSQYVVKLLTCEGMQMENKAPDILLPSSITVS